jgi:putative molybdopterin biosynthesis protein
LAPRRHLLDAATGQYNRPLLTAGLALITGYGRAQGVLFRLGDPRFTGRTAREAIQAVRSEPGCILVNRNQGSGTRILMDQLLEGARPDGYGVQPRNHNAVAAAVAQGRADWGLAIRSVADAQGLGFLPLANEQYDFVVPRDRLRRPAVRRLQELLNDETVRRYLRSLGFELDDVAATPHFHHP